MSERLRVVIAEDNYLVREGTRRLLEDSGEVEVVASVSTADELLEVVNGLRPDVVLTDIRMPPGHHLEGIQAAHAIRQRHRITQSKVGSRLPPSRQPGARQRVSGRVSSSWCPDAYLKPALWGSREHFRH